MTGKEIKKIKTDFIKLLKRKGTYEKETDDLLIDAIVFNLKLLQDARRDVECRGTMVQLGKDSNFYQINFAIGIFHNAVKSINTLYKQLGLEKIKEDVKPTDKFDVQKFINEGDNDQK